MKQMKNCNLQDRSLVFFCPETKPRRWAVTSFCFFPSHISLQNPLLMPSTLQSSANCIKNDVIAQHLGLASGQEKSRLILLQTLLGLMFGHIGADVIHSFQQLAKQHPMHKPPNIPVIGLLKSKNFALKIISRFFYIFGEISQNQIFLKYRKLIKTRDI